MPTSSSSSSSYKPGSKVPKSGTYELCNSDGSKTGFTVKVQADGHFPPADKSGQVYRMSSK